MIWSDPHSPFVDKKAVTELISLAADLKPTHIIQTGDLYDMLSHTRFVKSGTDLMTPKEEIAEGRAVAEEIWRMLRKRAPKAECHQLLGNHDLRPSKRLMEKIPELASLVEMKPIWDFDGVHTHMDPRKELLINGVAYLHGYRSKLGDHCRYMLTSCCVGHSHRGGVFFLPLANGKLIFELNAGHLGDLESAAMAYSPQKYNQWTTGVGWIDELGPRFIPL